MTRSSSTNPVQIRNYPGSLLFTGAANNYVDLPYSFDPTATEFSVLLWVRPTTMADIHSGTGTAHSYYSQQDGSGSGRTWMGMGRTGDDNYFESNYGGITQHSTYIMLGNVWQHLAITKNSSNLISYYVNGVLSGTNTATIDSANGTHRFGASKIGVANMYGYLGPTKIFTRKLSATEILSDYVNGSISDTSNLQALYNFTDGAGTTLTDTSGNSNHGTIVGSTVTWSTISPMKSRTIASGRTLSTGRTIA